jgi:hypothetical protein
LFIWFSLFLSLLYYLSSHSSILDITTDIIRAKKYLIAHSRGTVTIARAMIRKMEKKRETSFPPAIN